MHRQDEQRYPVGESAHRGRVPAVADDQRRRRHDLVMWEVLVQLDIAGRSERAGGDGAGGDDAPNRKSLKRVQDCLKGRLLTLEEERAQADEDERPVLRGSGLDGSLDHARVADVRR